VVKGLARVCDKLCYNGSYAVLIPEVKRNGDKLKNRDKIF
jgi:hypothetical protein